MFCFPSQVYCHIYEVKKMSLKFQEDLRSSGTHCLYPFLESEAQNDKVYKVEKSDKNKFND